jgi:hypothetical protein
MMGYWGGFARTGVPGDDARNGLARWAPWQADGDSLLLDSRITMKSGTETFGRIMDDLAQDQRLAGDADRCSLVRDLSALPGAPLDPRSRSVFEARFCQSLQPGR